MSDPVGYQVVAVVLVVLVAGCGGPGTTDTPTPTDIRSSPATDTPTEGSAKTATEPGTPDSSATDTPTSTPTLTPTPTPTPSPTSTPTPTATATPTATRIASPTATRTPAPTETPPRSERTEFRVEVVEVVDGDTLEVEYADGETETVRLLGVDTPEVHTDTDPAEWSGIPDTEAGRAHLRDWGHKASEYARTKLERGEEVRVVVDPESDRRGSYGRLLAYVYDDGDLFNLALLRQGYARMYDTEFAERSRFADAGATARANDVGVWGFEGATRTPTATSAGPSDAGGDGPAAALAITEIRADADGNDHENLDDEYLVFENTGDGTLDLSGWEVRDEADHTYRFPAGFTLDPGQRVTLYTGSGEDTGTELYWGSGRAVWNNGGDTIYVYDDRGTLRIERSYS